MINMQELAKGIFESSDGWIDLVPVIAIGLFLAHWLFFLRLAHILSGSVSLVVTWCLLNLGSFLLSATVVVGVYILGFYVTGSQSMALRSYLVLGIVTLIGIPYHILLSIQAARVMKWGGDRHTDRLEIVLATALTVAFTAVWLQVIWLLPALEGID